MCLGCLPEITPHLLVGPVQRPLLFAGGPPRCTASGRRVTGTPQRGHTHYTGIWKEDRTMVQHRSKWHQQLISLLMERKWNQTLHIAPHYVVRYEQRESYIKSKHVTKWRAECEGRCGGHTPVFRWWIFTFLSLWKISVWIKLTNRDWGGVSLSLHCGPDREKEKRRKTAGAKKEHELSSSWP